MSKIALVSPNLVAQISDPMTTGIVYMPVSLAYFAGTLKQQGHQLQVIDAFGENPNRIKIEEDFIIRGISPTDVAAKISADTNVIFLYAINLTYHRSVAALIGAIKSKFPKIPLVILENTQAVTAYSLRFIRNELYDLGADFILTGEAELRGTRLIEAISQNDLAKAAEIDGVGFRSNGVDHYTLPKEKITKLDELPFAAWELFPLDNYWSLRYSHGPQTTAKYLPLLTSRGCPYSCKFCVIPETNHLKWRARTAKSVVDEIAYYKEKFGVTEFHIEDVDPTIDDKRTQAICQEIIDRKLNITWKICAGTKVETMKSEKTIELMAKSGCKYISISPESGSPKVMKAINKPFNLNHAIQLVKKMNEVGIKSQACFVLGFPGEDDSDRQLTRKMALEMTRKGLDEIAIFVITPVPGSAIYDQFSGYKDYSQLNFSPTWREDYEKLNKFRVQLYRDFLFMKSMRYPHKILKQCFNFARRRFETKMEMAPYRALHTVYLTKRKGALSDGPREVIGN